MTFRARGKFHIPALCHESAESIAFSAMPEMNNKTIIRQRLVAPPIAVWPRVSACCAPDDQSRRKARSLRKFIQLRLRVLIRWAQYDIRSGQPTPKPLKMAKWVYGHLSFSFVLHSGAFHPMRRKPIPRITIRKSRVRASAAAKETSGLRRR